MTRTARPTDAAGRARWEETVRERRGRRPRKLELIEEPTDLSWEEAVARIARASEIISRIAARMAHKRDTAAASMPDAVHNGQPGDPQS